MATLPENVGFATEIEYVSQPSLTWLINRQTMRVQAMDEGLEAVRQAVEIYLNTDLHAPDRDGAGLAHRRGLRAPGERDPADGH